MKSTLRENVWEMCVRMSKQHKKVKKEKKELTRNKQVRRDCANGRENRDKRSIETAD